MTTAIETEVLVVLMICTAVTYCLSLKFRECRNSGVVSSGLLVHVCVCVYVCVCWSPKYNSTTVYQ